MGSADLPGHKDILELLKAAVGCTYISDLRFGESREKALDFLQNMDRGAYDAKKIKEAEMYLNSAEEK